MAEEKVNGPEDTIVAEMMKELPPETYFHEIARFFQARFVGH